MTTESAELKVLTARINAIKWEIRELESRKYEIEDQIEALEKELREVTDVAAPLNRRIWEAYGFKCVSGKATVAGAAL